MDDATLNQRFDSMAELIHQIAERIDEPFAALEGQMNQRFAAIEQRLDRIENRMTAMEFQMAGINRSVDSSDRQFSKILVTQGAQQKAIDDLAARITRLEQQR
jgi:archaellum component FlaC